MRKVWGDFELHRRRRAVAAVEREPAKRPPTRLGRHAAPAARDLEIQNAVQAVPDAGVRQRSRNRLVSRIARAGVAVDNVVPCIASGRGVVLVEQGGDIHGEQSASRASGDLGVKHASVPGPQ